MELQNKVAVVTGGTKGIGNAIAKSLAQAGASVVVTSRHRDQVDEAVDKLREVAADRVTGFACDVRQYDQVESLIRGTLERFGSLDILVNNAGIGMFGTVAEMDPEDFRAVIETNLLGVYYCCHEAIPHMKQRGGGYIINISSLAGTNAHPEMAAYNASKFGLNGFSEALMQEVRHDNIKVSYIMPGSVNTEFGDDEPDASKSWQLQPEDIAEVVMDLLAHPDRSLPSRVEIRPSKPR
ncbi:MAG TPA: SDR family oxidoreductase [Pyrinomonadaceae bacterium]|nr:SDR family oxidoreductase [Pyrinomonadaceae bacterium]